MEFFKKTPNIDFVGQTKYFVSFSLLLIAISLVSIAVKGFNFGTDFAGGTAIEVKLPATEQGDETHLRDALAAIGLDSASIVRLGEPEEREFRIGLAASLEESPTLTVDVVKALSEKVGGEVVLNSAESVGPRVGAELRNTAIWALVWSWVGILAYVAFRFQWQYAPGGVAALIHDVIVTAGFFSVFGWEFDLNVLAALLVIIGYSINDTIVIFDRIREMIAVRGTAELRSVVNEALNQTLSRTILTAFVTQLVVVALLGLGGPVLWGFSIALFIGIIAGCYSTVYVASATFLWLSLRFGAAVPTATSGKPRAKAATSS